MAAGGSLRLSGDPSIVLNYGSTKRPGIVKPRRHSLSSCASRQQLWTLHVSDQISRPKYHVQHRYNIVMCQSFALPSSLHVIPLLKTITVAFTRSCNVLRESPLALQLVPAVGIIAFAVWGLGPLMRYMRNLLLHSDINWKKSRTHYVFASYFQPLLLWAGATLICRALDPVVLSSESSQAVKQRLLNFVRSLSTVVAFAYCLSSLIQQTQKFFMEMSGADDTRNMGFQFAGKAVYTAVWVAAFSLFMELLGFSTQKWVTAGGLGTVLLTLAGREIFTNFLSSVMIHATRPFILNEWIQTKIEGYEVSGTVEHVGWWSPTIIRGDDREAVHIPNHKFTVSVVRNLSQKTHWRIKTHLAISHLDVNKINNIVADMRKVLAKNPHIEQQRLHRRVFLDNIDPENQALRILISCFVKTSHFEEYFCVKEAVLLDLLRVISHHQARLATPIRTVQKVYGDADLENIPFAETIFTHAENSNRRALLLIDPFSRINGEENAKTRQAPRATDEETAKTTASEFKVTAPTEETSLNSDKQQKEVSTKEAVPKSSKGDPVTQQLPYSPSKSDIQGLDAAGLTSSTGIEKLPSTKAIIEQTDGVVASLANIKSESDRSSSSSPTVARPTFEDNIVLGMALEGSKRTLPIEEGMNPAPSSMEASESAARRNGNTSSLSIKDAKRQITAVPGATTIETEGS